MRPPGKPDADHAYNLELSRPVFAEFARSRGISEPVFEEDDYAWIDEPTRKCDSDSCQNWFDVSRKTCPMCCYPRNRRKR